MDKKYYVISNGGQPARDRHGYLMQADTTADDLPAKDIAGSWAIFPNGDVYIYFPDQGWTTFAQE